MTPSDFSTKSEPPLSHFYPVIDTHTHFDAPIFDEDRETLIQEASEQGVRHLVLVGYLYRHFGRMYETKQLESEQFKSQPSAKMQKQLSGEQDISQNEPHINMYVALGLHPFYIEQHTDDHLKDMAQMIANNRPLAIGEIGLDTFTAAMKVPEVFAKQERFFKAQLDMAVNHKLPVMLHIRKAHAEALAILKAHEYDAHKLGGIAHSFSGGVQEAKAFVKLGFKLGVTGQVTNPNAKKLRLALQAAVDEYGIECLVIETDCPDMLPVMCRTTQEDDASIPDRNVPANLPWVLLSLSELLDIPTDILAEQLWHNSCTALQTTWNYPK